MSGPTTSPGKRRIGFVSTRFGGTDGVSLETEKWLTVLDRLGYACFFFAGECAYPSDLTRIVPEAHFKHPEVTEAYAVAFSSRTRPPETTRLIHRLKDLLKGELYAFVHDFGIQMLIAENALAIPLNIPLGLALTEFIAETGIPTIAHHHDFFWERSRFLVNCVWDYLNMAFPPHLPSIRHVVINSSGANQLGLRTGVSSMIVPNVMDFEHPPGPAGEYAERLRQDLGLEPDEYLFLQPTRVVQRKGIENAIELIERLGVKARLVISHASGDEGHAYEQRVVHFADLLGVRMSLVSDIIGERRSRTADGRRVYSLADAYAHADLVTYPSTLEGFGNAFLEAVYYRRPLLVNNYSIFAIDIKPLGFRVIEFDGYITDDTVRDVERLLGNPALAAEMTERNYQLGRRHYSLATLERCLQTLVLGWFGEEPE